MKSNRWVLWSAVCAFALVLVGVGCRPSSTPLAEPFRHVATWDDGRAIALSGDSRGYRGGITSVLEVSAHNRSQEEWRDGYCLLLVDQAGIRSHLTEGRLDLTPGEGFTDVIRVTLPTQVGQGRYGLVLLIRGAGSLTATDLVGTPPRESQAGHWATPAQCAAGNLPDARSITERVPLASDLAPRAAQG